MFATYNGAEVIPAKDNLFYSHSYIFNYGPFIHTGAMVTTHVKPWLDVYTGVTSGVNTSLGWPGDNNAAASFHGGFGFNLLDGNLTIMAITHTGPENQRQTDPLGVGWPVGFANGIPFTPDGLAERPHGGLAVQPGRLRRAEPLRLRRQHGDPFVQQPHDDLEGDRESDVHHRHQLHAGKRLEQ